MPQNLTFPVQPDPISGMHCWHQKVTIQKAEPDDRYGDVFVDTERSHGSTSAGWPRHAVPVPGGLRRPLWMNRPLRPAAGSVLPPRLTPAATADARRARRRGIMSFSGGPEDLSQIIHHQEPRSWCCCPVHC